MANSPYELKKSDIPLFEYGNIFIANMIWRTAGLDKTIATFGLTIRDMPDKWNYFIFNGLDRFIENLKAFKFDSEAIRIIKNLKLIDSPATERYYRNFRFKGDIYTLRDGRIFFPGEPILRITAPLLETNLLTAFAMNSFNYPILSLTKGVRIKSVSKDKILILVGTRLNSFEQGVIAERTSFLLDTYPNAQLIFLRKHPEFMKRQGSTPNINHAIVKSFPKEADAFRHGLNMVLPRAEIFSVMVDTYNFENGLKTLIREMDRIKNKKALDRKMIVAIDSGDIKSRARYARKILDRAGYKKVKVQALGNLDEYKISKLIKAKVPIDVICSVTEFVNVTDAPKLEAVYKMAELRFPDGKIEQKAKLTKGKESYPGRKQIFRRFKKGKMAEDIIGLENEKLGEPLLEKFVEQGKIIRKVPALEETKVFLKEELKTLPEKLKDVNRKTRYQVSLSRKLNYLLKEVKRKHG